MLTNVLFYHDDSQANRCKGSCNPVVGNVLAMICGGDAAGPDGSVWCAFPGSWPEAVRRGCMFRAAGLGRVEEDGAGACDALAIDTEMTVGEGEAATDALYIDQRDDGVTR